MIQFSNTREIDSCSCRLLVPLGLLYIAVRYGMGLGFGGPEAIHGRHVSAVNCPLSGFDFEVGTVNVKKSIYLKEKI